MANKLELTWYGKDNPIKVEPRLLIENAVLSNTNMEPETDNMLIHGDNLLALKALELIKLEYTSLFDASFQGFNTVVGLEDMLTKMSG